jgi:hypothetical protein
VLAERSGFFQDADLDFAERSTCFAIGLDQPGKLNCSRESGRAPSNEENIHRNGFGVGRLGQYQPVQRQRRLMPAWQNAQRTIRH